jgi:hypothetical protein
MGTKALAIAFFVVTVLLVAVICYLIATRPKVVEISDTLPQSKRRKDCWLKLQNEGKQYLKIKDGRVYLKIIP